MRKLSIFSFICVFAMSVAAVHSEILEPSHATPDTSSPVAALKSFQSATRNQDRPAIENLFFSNDDREKTLAGVIAEMIVATRKLELSIETKFPGNNSVSAPASDEKKLDRATVKITGNLATLIPDGQKKEIHFRNASQNAIPAWRLIVHDYAVADMEIDRQISLLQKSVGVIERVRADVEQGQFKSAADAQSAMQKQLATIMMRAATRPSTTSSTRPATNPATSPATTPAKSS